MLFGFLQQETLEPAQPNHDFILVQVFDKVKGRFAGDAGLLCILFLLIAWIKTVLQKAVIKSHIQFLAGLREHLLGAGSVLASKSRADFSALVLQVLVADRVDEAH